jgi:oligoendopeptidase F
MIEERREPATSAQRAGGEGETWDHAGLEPGDLYRAQFEGVQADLTKAADEVLAIKQRYQGKLAQLASDGARLAEAIAAYESLSDTIGRLGSYAGLLYAADTSNPEHAKFYGDIQEKITSITTDLIFFELELNKIEEAQLARRCRFQHGSLQAVARRLARRTLSAGRALGAVPRRSHLPRTAPGAGCSVKP